MQSIKWLKISGPDGFSTNFYKKLWPELKHHLHSALMKVVHDNQMFESALQGVVSLMEKPQKNALTILNWRPLTMLNTDYKIYAKMLANRLQVVLPRLIHSDQVGFMKGRVISTNIGELLTVIDYCNENKIEAIITSVDYEKALIQ